MHIVDNKSSFNHLSLYDIKAKGKLLQCYSSDDIVCSS